MESVGSFVNNKRRAIFKAIGFDWSGVVFFHPMTYAEAGSEFLGISQEEFRAAYFKYNHLLNIENGEPRDAWRKVFSELGRASEVDGFLNFLKKLPAGRINQEILSLIKKLQDKGYKIGLFSNNTLPGAIEARSFGADDIFEVALFSAEVNVMKPDPKAFELLADKLGVDITKMMYIDDALKSFEKADIAGYHPILYKGMPDLLKELERHEILSADESAMLMPSQ